MSKEAQHRRRPVAALLLLLLLCTAAAALLFSAVVPSQAAVTVGKRSANKLNITVHLVCHTHDDAGWLKTVDQYFYGANNSITPSGTRYIIDSVVRELQRVKSRRFTYVEMSFFWRWWNMQNDEDKEKVRQLVKEERLQFANGGWCMHDEATPYYTDMIDQTTLGHRFLKRELNGVPLVGWQVDPFGHSNTHAHLLAAKAGFIANFFGRADYEDFNARAANREREFTWKPSASRPQDKVLGGVFLNNHYGSPGQFHWDVLFNRAEPIMDQENLKGYNVEERVDTFVDLAVDTADQTLGKNVLWTMGDDFTYMDANEWYANLDRLIQHVNDDGRVEVLYSTPYDYAKAKLDEGLTFPEQTEDFFPYEDRSHSDWTGYFTSRPSLKRFIRETSAYYTTSRQIQAVAQRTSQHVSTLADALGIAQHHDAITGTAKQHVTFDYEERLAAGVADDMTWTARSMDYIAGLGTNQPVRLCVEANISVCASTAAIEENPSKPVYVIVWNALAQPLTGETVYVPVPTDKILVSLPYSLIPTTTPLYDNYRKRDDAQPYLIAVQLDLPALGFANFSIQSSAVNGPRKAGRARRLLGLAGAEAQAQAEAERRDPQAGFKNAKEIPAAERVMENEYLKVSFNAEDGWISRVENKKTGTVMDLETDWCFYDASAGDSVSTQTSGAYVFRPKDDICRSLADSHSETSVVRRFSTTGDDGAQFYERRINSWIVERLFLQKNDRSLRHEFTVGPIDIERYSDNGVEVVHRFHTNVQNAATFYTDSNGREMQKRVRDQRYYKFTQTEPIAGNYYPVASMISIKDTERQLTVLVDAPVGGSSITDSTMEIMIHRRMLMDDWRGVDEPLNESAGAIPYVECGNLCGKSTGPGLITRGTHFWTIESAATAMEVSRPLQDKIHAHPQLFYTSVESKKNSGVSFLGVEGGLPVNVQLITLQRVEDSLLLVRFAHQFAVGESSTYSADAQIDLQAVLSKFNPVSAQRTTITTSQDIDSPIAFDGSSPVLVTITAMDVLTYLVTLKA